MGQGRPEVERAAPLKREALALKWGAQCASCPFSKGGKPNNPVFGEGPADAVGVLLGEGPGSDEARAGRPFVGSTGAQLDRVLLDHGISRGRMFVVNATACRPPPDGKGKMGQAVKCCAPVLEKQLRPHRGKPTFAMGNGAWLALAGRIPKGGLDKGRGFIRMANDGTPFIATWHPSFAFFYNPWEWGAFEVDLAKFKRLYTHKLLPGPRQLIPFAKPSQIRKLIAEGLPLGVDIETAPAHRGAPWTGKDPTRALLRTIGIGNRHWGVSFRWEKASNTHKELLQSVMTNHRTIWQNGQWFDHRVLRRYGFKLGKKWDDIRDMRKALVTTSALNLGYMATLYDDPIPWKEEDEDDDKGIVFTDNMRDLMVYNAQDAVEQARVYHGIRKEPEFHTERVQGLYRLHRELSITAAEMHSAGIYVSKMRRRYLSAKLAKVHQERKKKLIEFVGLPNFTGTPNDLRAIIYKRHERKSTHPNGKLKLFSLPDPLMENMFTASGECAVSKEALLMLITDPDCPDRLKEIIDLYWQASAPQKAASTFVDSDLVEHAIGLDGRLRPGWNSNGPDTGRFSCSEPNVMNLSEKKE